jgi:predicted secreted protein with PEFG-CTERM motif
MPQNTPLISVNLLKLGSFFYRRNMSNKTSKHSSILLAIMASATILGSGMHVAYAQTTLTVETDADSYETGDTVTITGQLSATTINQPLLVQILDPQGNRDRIDQVEAAADGSYSYEFTTGGLMNTDGTYTVLVSYKTTDEETTFDYTFTGEETGWKTIQAMIGGQNHPIQYMISGSGNRLVSITGDVDTITLLATLSTQSDGTLSLRFDEETFDADEEFFVFADEIPATVEDNSEGSVNTIHIDFEAGTEEIEIVGDSIIPEFGTIAAIVLAVAIVGIIVATARYGKLNRFVRKDW